MRSTCCGRSHHPALWHRGERCLRRHTVYSARGVLVLLADLYRRGTLNPVWVVLCGLGTTAARARIGLRRGFTCAPRICRLALSDRRQTTDLRHVDRLFCSRRCVRLRPGRRFTQALWHSAAYPGGKDLQHHCNRVHSFSFLSRFRVLLPLQFGARHPLEYAPFALLIIVGPCCVGPLWRDAGRLPPSPKLYAERRSASVMI